MGMDLQDDLLIRAFERSLKVLSGQPTSSAAEQSTPSSRSEPRAPSGATKGDQPSRSAEDCLPSCRSQPPISEHDAQLAPALPSEAKQTTEVSAGSDAQQPRSACGLQPESVDTFALATQAAPQTKPIQSIEIPFSPDLLPGSSAKSMSTQGDTSPRLNPQAALQQIGAAKARGSCATTSPPAHDAHTNGLEQAGSSVKATSFPAHDAHNNGLEQASSIVKAAASFPAQGTCRPSPAAPSPRVQVNQNHLIQHQRRHQEQMALHFQQHQQQQEQQQKLLKHQQQQQDQQQKQQKQQQQEEQLQKQQKQQQEEQEEQRKVRGQKQATQQHIHSSPHQQAPHQAAQQHMHSASHQQAPYQQAPYQPAPPHIHSSPHHHPQEGPKEPSQPQQSSAYNPYAAYYAQANPYDSSPYYPSSYGHHQPPTSALFDPWSHWYHSQFYQQPNHPHVGVVPPHTKAPPGAASTAKEAKMGRLPGPPPPPPPPPHFPCFILM